MQTHSICLEQFYVFIRPALPFVILRHLQGFVNRGAVKDGVEHCPVRINIVLGLNHFLQSRPLIRVIQPVGLGDQFSQGSKAQAYVAEGRVMVLELMGHLASYYRTYSLGTKAVKINDTPIEEESDE